MALLVGIAAGRLLVCGGASKARPGNYICYHALVSCNHVERLCAGDQRVITILPPTVRVWHLKEDGRESDETTAAMQNNSAFRLSLSSRIGATTSTALGPDVIGTSGPEPSGLPTGPVNFSRAQSTKPSLAVQKSLGCIYKNP